jgi:hypothetical protein
MYENRILRRILGPKRENRKCRKLNNVEIRNLYSSSITVGEIILRYWNT